MSESIDKSASETEQNGGAEEKVSSVTEQRRTMFENGKIQAAFVESLISPELIEAFRQIQNSDVVKQMRMISESPAVKAMQRVRDSITSYQRVFQELPELFLSPETLRAIRAVRGMAQSIERMQSPLVEYLASVRTGDLGRLLEVSGDVQLSAVVSGNAKVITKQEVVLEREIVACLQRGDSPESLPREQRNYLNWVISLFIAWLIYLGNQGAVRQELCFFQPKILPGLTANQAGKAVRQFLCEADLPAEMLQGFRLVDGVGVRLREGPSTKSAVIPITLPDKAVLEVLDLSNRDWLHVSVVGEDGVEGWISRKYTYRLNR
ncbi:SH3 domain-containing protein [Pseudomonas sp. SJZ085]|uniref:SH3 domain-containing protein n=1 Tax=unclassified Pseudomonas TaxID=196821 RepID=UPI00119AA0D0|nr:MULTISPECIES: SH3 domain-containing protein [unclassified Pseudomonas]TWC14755.1 SH3 domain-containing protein [Pseudomonas sp. SJZ074]TWC33109.1 SH3 domain-containing protein [Pseudomonas sp. SJZ085]